MKIAIFGHYKCPNLKNQKLQGVHQQNVQFRKITSFEEQRRVVIFEPR